jgi:hypothetical protein
MWQSLGLSNIIHEAMVIDRSGSAVLEHLIRLPDNIMPGLTVVKMKETILVTAWYPLVD